MGNVSAPSIMHMHAGESEKNIRSIFHEAKSYICKSIKKENEENEEKKEGDGGNNEEGYIGTMLFIDEIDSIAPRRTQTNSNVARQVVATLAAEMDELSNNNNNEFNRVVVLAASNRLGDIDEGLRRPGRFDREIEVGIPTSEQRCLILKAHLENLTHSISPQCIASVAESAHGFVGADLAAICREAVMISVSRYRQLMENNNINNNNNNHIEMEVSVSG